MYALYIAVYPCLSYNNPLNCDKGSVVTVTNNDLDRTHAQATLMPPGLSMNGDDGRTQLWVWYGLDDRKLKTG